MRKARDDVRAGDGGVKLIPFRFVTGGARRVVPATAWMILARDRLDVVVARCTGRRLRYRLVILAIGTARVARLAVANVLRPLREAIIVHALPKTDDPVGLAGFYARQIRAIVQAMNQHAEINSVPRLRIDRLVGMARDTQPHLLPRSAVKGELAVTRIARVRAHNLARDRRIPTGRDKGICLVGHRAPPILVNV